MTIEIKVTCDGLGCCNERPLDTSDLRNETEQIEDAGWHEDPEYNCYHYCKKCWPEVKAEKGL